MVRSRLRDLRKLQDRVYHSLICDVNQLKSRLIEEWEHFHQVFIDEAIRHPRLRSCIRACGGHFKLRLWLCLMFAQCTHVVMARYGRGGKRWIRYDTAQNIAIRYDTIRYTAPKRSAICNGQQSGINAAFSLTHSHAFKRHQR